MRKVLASGGRVANTPSSGSSHSGSSSTKLMKSRSRLDIPGARKEGVPTNMVGKVHFDVPMLCSYVEQFV